MTFPKCLLVCFLGLSFVCCGSDSKSTAAAAGSTDAVDAGTSIAMTTPGHQAAQASQESADNAASSDDVTGQQSSATGHVAARQLSRSASSIIDAESLMHYTQIVPENAHRKLISSEQINTSFDVFGCTAVFDGRLFSTASGFTLDANLTYDANTCTRSRTVSGSASLAAIFQTDGRTVNVTQNMNQTLDNGDIISITSQDANQATYALTSNSYASAGNVVSTIAVNEHRTRKTAEGNIIFDVSINTDPNNLLSITNNFVSDANTALTQKAVQTRTIVSGVNTVVYHTASDTSFTAKHTFNNLSRLTQTCMCPTAGTLTEDVTLVGDDTAVYTRVYTFTGCGTASVDVAASSDPNVVVGTTQVSWDSCN